MVAATLPASSAFFRAASACTSVCGVGLSSGVEPPQPTVVYTGNPDRYQDLDVLLRALQLLRRPFKWLFDSKLANSIGLELRLMA